MEKISNINQNDSLLRVKRIEELMENEGYEIGRKTTWKGTEYNHKNQEDFADAIGMWPSNFSRAMNGNITENMCRKIINAFPKYNLYWLLGYEDWMTNADKFSAMIQAINEEATSLHTGLISFAKLSGFQIDFAPITGNGSLEKTFKNMNEYCTISRNGKSITFSLSELNAFENELCDYMEFRLMRMMK